MSKATTRADPLESVKGVSREAGLVEACAILDLVLTAQQREKLLSFLALLQRWNAVYNLTGVRDPERMLTHHILDCLAVITPLNRVLGGASRPTFLDVGSGAGLPGAVLAIANSELEVSCIDAVGKKSAFVNQVAAELALSNLSSIHGRVEHLRQEFDVVASRAFASLTAFTSVTRHCLADNGVWLAMKGNKPLAEIEALPAAVHVFHVEQVSIPGLTDQRCLVWMKPGHIEAA